MRRLIRRLDAPALAAALVAAAVSPGCGQDPAAAEAVRKGGAITPAACGYTVSTRVGASAPLPGSAVLGAAPTPTQIHLGLAGDPARSMVVLWRTDADTRASTVEFGTDGRLDQRAEGFTFVYQVPNQGLVRMHEVHLCGLEPDREYGYRVGGEDKGRGATAFSDVATFRTAPERGRADAEVVFLLIGDTRGGYDTWGRSLAQAFATARPDAILFSGDAVTLGQAQPEWDTWFEAAAPYLRSAPLVPAHGNHEALAVNFFSQFAAPGDEESFALDYGPVHLTVFNDTPEDPATLAAATAGFVDGDLAAAAAPFRLVMHHRPTWSSSPAHGGDAQLRALFGPLFDRHRVDLVLNGHDHAYERTLPLLGGAVQAAGAAGTTYVVAGSAGAPLYDAGRDVYTAVSDKTYSHVILRARASRLQLDAYRADGSRLDALTLSK